MGNIQKMTLLHSAHTVAIAGSRSLTSCPALLERLEQLRAAQMLGQVVSGGATGIDTLAVNWCRAHDVPLVELRPDYRRHGAAAPHVRNAEIVQRAGLVLLCWDGQSAGTLSTWRAAQRLGRRCEWLAAPPPDGGSSGTGWLL